MVGDISLVSSLSPQIPLTLFKPKHPLGQVVSGHILEMLAVFKICTYVNNIDLVVLVILYADFVHM